MTTIRNKAPLYASKRLLSYAISTSFIAGCSSVSEVSTATQDTFHSLSALATNVSNDEQQLEEQLAEDLGSEPLESSEQDIKPSDDEPLQQVEGETKRQPAEELSAEPQENPDQEAKPSDETSSEQVEDETKGQPAEEPSAEPQEKPDQEAKPSDETPPEQVEDETKAQPIEEQITRTNEQDISPLKHLTFNPNLSAPILPKIDFEFKAPATYDHPLQYSERLTFMLGEDDKGHYLYGEGPITKDAFDKFMKYVNYYKGQNINLDRLMLHSPGGLVNQGLRIGEYIKKNSWATDLDKYMKCYSSCGFIYSAGVAKRFQEGAEVGYHRPYLPSQKDTPEFIEQVYNDYQPYWDMVDGDPKLYNKFMKDYGRDEMYILTEQDIEQYMTVEKY